MKISQLVKLRTELTEVLGSVASNVTVIEKIELLSNLKLRNQLSSQHESNIDRFINEQHRLILANDNISIDIKQSLNEINAELKLLESQLFASESYQHTFDGLTAITHSNKLSLNDSIAQLINSRIEIFNNWRYPGLHIFPKSKELIDLTVGLDPLYLAYQSVDDPTIKLLIEHNFNELANYYAVEYQNRLRKYPIVNYKFDQLPQNQFSFILCWDFFNYVSFPTIKDCITQIVSLLRPGGTFMFSYNNCDIYESVISTEFSSMSYVTKDMIKDCCREQDDIIFFDYPVEIDGNISSYVSWCELRKPGVLTTVKAHQVAGKILEK